VIEATGTREQRYRLLPARLVVYYVLAMTLFPQAGYEEVLRSLTEGLAWGTGWTDHWEVPSQVAISKARARLGRAPLVELFARACRPLAGPATPGAFYRGLRLVGLDGTTLDLADTAAHAAHNGRPGSGRGEGVGAFPQLRMVALAECGTHAMFAATMGPYTTGQPDRTNANAIGSRHGRSDPTGSGRASAAQPRPRRSPNPQAGHPSAPCSHDRAAASGR